MRSWAAKCLAVRKVTQDNRGKKTAGVDGVKDLAPAQRLDLARTLRPQPKVNPVRRVWIPKPGKAEQRPLGIPTMRDRATQTLVRLALEPEWEARFEPNSYGFRPGRSCHDAREAIFNGVRYKAKYVLDADIAACLEPSSHCPHGAGEGREKVRHGLHLLGHLDTEARLASSVDVDGAQLAALDTLQDGLPGDAQRLHRRAHRQPAGRRVFSEAGTQLVGQANLPGCAWRDLLAGEEAVLQPAV
jgi:hypothetical protein